MEKIDKSQLDNYLIDNWNGGGQIMPILTNKNIDIILNKVNELVDAFNELEKRLNTIDFLA